MSTSPRGPEPPDQQDCMAETMAGNAPTPPAGIPVQQSVSPPSSEFAVHSTLPTSSPGAAGASASKGFPVHDWARYEFIRLLGRGGMGAVYMARDRRLGRIVALKFLRTDDPAMVQRFQHEARAQARIDHPLICKVFEVGEVEDKAYIAMHKVGRAASHR